MGNEGIARTIHNRPWQEAVPSEANSADTTSRPPARQKAVSMDRYLFFGNVIDTIAQGSAFQT
jgi:hypothetical protein